MRFLETTTLTMQDWLVDIHFDDGVKVRKGVTPKLTKEKAIYMARSFVPISAWPKIKEITARRREELSAPIEKEIEVRLT